MSTQETVADDRMNPRRPRCRSEVPFSWVASCGISAYGALANVPFDLLFFDADAIREAYTVGYPRAREWFGPDVSYAGPNFEQISYGHINCLGCELKFAADSEPMYTPLEGCFSRQGGISMTPLVNF